MTLTQFDDLRAGGLALAEALREYGTERDAIVLGIVRGGVHAALEVARSLDLSLDLVLRRALFKDASGDLLCAVRAAGTLVLDERCPGLPPGSPERTFLDDALSQLAAREQVCRGPRAPARLSERTVLLIDNGMRTGQTMAAVIRAVRTMGPGRVVAAIPAGTPSAVERTMPLADDLFCLATSASLGNVAMAYRRFDVPDEARIRDLVDAAASARSRSRACVTSDHNGSGIADV